MSLTLKCLVLVNNISNIWYIFQVLVIVSSLFLLSSIIMLILSTIPTFQVLYIILINIYSIKFKTWFLSKKKLGKPSKKKFYICHQPGGVRGDFRHQPKKRHFREAFTKQKKCNICYTWVWLPPSFLESVTTNQFIFFLILDPWALLGKNFFGPWNYPKNMWNQPKNS